VPHAPVGDRPIDPRLRTGSGIIARGLLHVDAVVQTVEQTTGRRLPPPSDGVLRDRPATALRDARLALLASAPGAAWRRGLMVFHEHPHATSRRLTPRPTAATSRRCHIAALRW
jgi:hypothetical protein